MRGKKVVEIKEKLCGKESCEIVSSHFFLMHTLTYKKLFRTSLP